MVERNRALSHAYSGRAESRQDDLAAWTSTGHRIVPRQHTLVDLRVSSSDGGPTQVSVTVQGPSRRSRSPSNRLDLHHHRSPSNRLDSRHHRSPNDRLDSRHHRSPSYRLDRTHRTSPNNRLDHRRRTSPDPRIDHRGHHYFPSRKTLLPRAPIRGERREAPYPTREATYLVRDA